jgi:predicted transposase/invertase (TIGR01784 family)
VQLLDKQTFEVFYDKLTFIFVELSRFRKKGPELRTHFDKWLSALKHMRTLKARPAFLWEKIFEKLFSEAEIAKLTPQEMKTYQESLKVYRDNQNAMDYMLKKGLEKGVQQGLEKGVKQGRYEERTEIARGMKRINIPVDQIMEITKLTKEEIEKL